MKRILVVLCLALMLTGSVAAQDLGSWNYDAEKNLYWQTGLSYAESPADSTYETMGIFVPAAYFEATDRGDGTYDCTVRAGAEAGLYTSETAPWILPVNTPGYSAMAAPVDSDSSMGYGSIQDYTDAGMIVLFAGARGRDAGAPAGVTDFKAAIRYARAQAAALPGDSTRLFTLGMSGGGAQSAILGASGDSALYLPYLEAIGAVMTESDAVLGSMCWCPITNLDVADLAYEWNMGSTRTGLSDFEQELSDGMAEAFAMVLNAMGLQDPEGNALILEPSDSGFWQAGTYYEYVKRTIEVSLEHFLEDTAFPYTVSSSKGFGGPGQGRGGNRDGNFPGKGIMDGGTFPEQMKPDGDLQQDYAAMDGITRTGGAGLSLDGTYETAQAYIDALNAEGEWISYDPETGKVQIESVSAFAGALKNASKGIAAFDQLDRGQGENTLFGYGDGSGAHFDAVLAELVSGSEYEADFEEDLTRTDALGNQAAVRVDMYNPMYYLCGSYEGFGTSAPARYWRIRTGINQGDTALCTEINLALAAEAYSPENTVDFETVWGQGHTEAERTGTAVSNFLDWVADCLSAQ